jgi:predicted amidohydrolase
VVIGIAELDPNTRGTVYCTLLFIGREGKILGRHRKLKPTDEERRVWGEGDGVGLEVYQRPYGRISGLNCWEHNMVLPGYALMAQGTQIHIAAWPFTSTLDPVESSGALLSRAFARQGSCYVIASCALLQADDAQNRYREIAAERQREYAQRKGSCRIIAPGGKVIAEAPLKEEAILTASVSLEAVFREKGKIDVAGHYSRPDVLKLMINRSPLQRFVELGAADYSGAAAGEQFSDNSPNPEGNGQVLDEEE